MKILKRLAAALLMIMLVFSFAGCHKKDEIAVKVGDVEFTSAYYMCALINADSQAKTIIYEDLTDEEKESSDIDYYSKKVEGEEYVEWVEKTAIDTLKKIAAYKTLCAKNELEIDEEKKTEAEQYASYYWSSYGYSVYFEPNGVSQATYVKYMTDSYYSERYFEYIYGKEGEKAIASDKVLETMYDNFIIANVIDASFNDEMTDKDKTELKTKLESYMNDLKNGAKTFEEVYNDYNGVEEKEETETTDTEETDEPAPKDKYASVLGAEDTVYEYEYFEEVEKLKTGEITIIEKDDDAGLTLVVKQDISADPYYAESLDMISRHIIADQEFEKDIEKYAEKLETVIEKYAVNQFKVKKIKQPQY